MGWKPRGKVHVIDRDTNKTICGLPRANVSVVEGRENFDKFAEKKFDGDKQCRHCTKKIKSWMENQPTYKVELQSGSRMHCCGCIMKCKVSTEAYTTYELYKCIFDIMGVVPIWMTEKGTERGGE